MKEETIAPARYARALFGAAVKSGDEDKIQEDLEDLNRVMKDSGLGAFLSSPRPSPADKRKAVTRVASLLHSRLSGSFLHLLLRKARLGILPAVLVHYAALWREARGLVRAELIVTGTPNEAFKKRISESLARITGKKIDLIVRQDPSLGGGFVVKVLNDLIDASVRTRLDTLKKELLETSIN